MPDFASFDWYEINSSAIDTNNGRNKLWGNPELTSILQNAVPLLFNSVPEPPEKSWFLSIKTPKFLKIGLQSSLLFNNEIGKTSLYL